MIQLTAYWLLWWFFSVLEMTTNKNNDERHTLAVSAIFFFCLCGTFSWQFTATLKSLKRDTSLDAHIIDQQIKRAMFYGFFCLPTLLPSTFLYPFVRQIKCKTQTLMCNHITYNSFSRLVSLWQSGVFF